ncbi:MAG TPA: S-layer homology domain-containing protein [Bacillota bacterium]|nr:S-layer homology domain-containing protein [Bacillota bacterium]
MKKKFILILLVVLILYAQMAVPVNAAGLPDKWEAPSGLILTDASISNEEFMLKLTYNKGAGLSEYLSLKIADQLAKYGYSCGKAVIQVDWTADSTEDGWKYHENWDVIKHGEGSHGSTNWEYYSIGLRPQTTDNLTILRLAHEDDWRWKDPVQGIERFLEGKTYSFKNGYGRIAHFIDLTKHTVYVRARFVTMLQDAQYNQTYMFSDWSDIVAIGKDADRLPKRPESLETPVLSNLHITDEIMNGAPVAAFNLSNPQQVKDASTYAISQGERCIVVSEVSVNNGPWIEVGLVNSDVKDGVYKAPLFKAAPELQKASSYELIPDSLKGADMIQPITREEFAEIAVKLYELYTGKKGQAGNVRFTDTSNPEILKAANMGMVLGVGDNKFAPKQLVTREQMATILLRALKVLKPAADFSITGVSMFADDKNISAWAKDGVYYSSKAGIIKGVGSNQFDPKDNSTREAAIIACTRAYEYFKSNVQATGAADINQVLIGKWSLNTPDGTYFYQFKEDKTLEVSKENDSTGGHLTFMYELEGNQLTVYYYSTTEFAVNGSSITEPEYSNKQVYQQCKVQVVDNDTLLMDDVRIVRVK